MKYEFSGLNGILHVRVSGDTSTLKPVPYKIFANPDITLQGDKLEIKTATQTFSTRFDGDHIASINGQNWATLAQSETNLNTLNEAMINSFMDIMTQVG